MNVREFYKILCRDKGDIFPEVLEAIKSTSLTGGYCFIGGFATNAYVEPLLSLDLDVVIAIDKVEDVLTALEPYCIIKKSQHMIDLKCRNSELRIQIHTDPRCQVFLRRACFKKILGFRIRVAALEDVLQGILWDYADSERRASKRQKNLLDIVRLLEEYPELKKITKKYGIV